MSTHAIDRMGTPVGLFGATRASPSAGRKARSRLWGPVLGSVAAHVALIAGAWTIEIPTRAVAPKGEPIEVSLLAGPGPAAGAPDLPPGPPAAPPAPPAPVRRAAPPAPRQQAPKVLAVAPPVEERPAPKEEPVAEAPSVQEAAPAEETETEVEALPEERSLLDGALADASGALHGQRGGVGGGLGGGGGGSGSHQGGGSAYGNALVDGSTVAVSPRVLEKVQPDYPRMARRRGVEGEVLLRVVVDKKGRVEPDQIQVLASVPGLDAASVAAVKQWRFTPGRDRTGAPLRVFIRVPFRFTLQ